ncbi:MAG: hypothetical protein J5496_06265 [Lachnospiraceae bacterium]|nr:hypothetical protein [Lachnospiraceae bacterium]
MRKRKTPLTLLAAILLLTLLPGCGTAPAPTQEQPAPTEAPTQEPTQKPTQAPTQGSTAAPAPTAPPETKPTVTTQSGTKGMADGPAGGSWKIGSLGIAWKTYQYAGQEVCRRYYYYIPSSYQKGEPLPLMISLPGSGTSASFQMNEGKWKDLAEREGFVLLAPEYVCLHADRQLSAQGYTQYQIGQDSSSNMRWVATGAEPVAAHGIDDVAYLTDLMDLFIEEGFVDEHRVFASGLSHGAYMAQRLAIEIPERLAGVGLVASGIYFTFGSNVLTNKVRIVYIQGTQDPIVPYDGIWAGAQCVSYSLPKSIDWFLSRYGVTAEPVVTELPDTDPSDGCTITRSEYRNDDGTPQLIAYVVNGGGHTWPGGTQYLVEGWIGKLCKDAQASELIWNDLKDATNIGTQLP